MPSRAELEIRAGNVGVDPANYPNDSNLEQKTIYEEKLAGTAAAVKAVGTLTSDATAPSNNDTVTLDDQVYTFKTALTGKRASGTITHDGTAPSDGDTVTIGNKTYTFKTALTPTEGQVLIGASADAAITNLFNAINHTGTPDTDYKCAAAHTQVRGQTLDTSANTVLVQAISVGTAGNALVFTETSSHLSMDGSGVLGGTVAGVASVANEVLIGGSAAVALDNIKLAVNASAATAYSEEYSVATVVHPTVTATTNTNTTQLFEAKTAGDAGNSIVFTEAGTHTSADGSGFLGGTTQGVDATIKTTKAYQVSGGANV